MARVLASFKPSYQRHSTSMKKFDARTSTENGIRLDHFDLCFIDVQMWSHLNSMMPSTFAPAIFSDRLLRWQSSWTRGQATYFGVTKFQNNPAQLMVCHATAVRVEKKNSFAIRHTRNE